MAATTKFDGVLETNDAGLAYTPATPRDVDAIREWHFKHDSEVRAWAYVLDTIQVNISEAERFGTVDAATVRVMHRLILDALARMKADPARHLLDLADDYRRIAGEHAENPAITDALAAWRKVGLNRGLTA